MKSNQSWNTTLNRGLMQFSQDQDNSHMSSYYRSVSLIPPHSDVLLTYTPLWNVLFATLGHSQMSDTILFGHSSYQHHEPNRPLFKFFIKQQTAGILSLLHNTD